MPVRVRVCLPAWERPKDACVLIIITYYDIHLVPTDKERESGRTRDLYEYDDMTTQREKKKKPVNQPRVTQGQLDDDNDDHKRRERKPTNAIEQQLPRDGQEDRDHPLVVHRSSSSAAATPYCLAYIYIAVDAVE